MSIQLQLSNTDDKGHSLLLLFSICHSFIVVDYGFSKYFKFLYFIYNIYISTKRKTFKYSDHSLIHKYKIKKINSH